MHIVVFFFSLLKTLNHLFALQIVVLRTALEVNLYQGASGVSLRNLEADDHFSFDVVKYFKQARLYRKESYGYKWQSVLYNI